MMKTFALAALAVATLATATVSGPSEALAQEKTGQSTGGESIRSEALCTKPGTKFVYPCTLAEKRKLDASYRSKNPAIRNKATAQDRAARQQQEMDAEARAYKKMSEDRKRNAPTTEHCYMKNGNLECKPAP